MTRRPRAGVRGRWLKLVYADREVSDACRVLLLLLAEHMTDTGRVSVPRDRLASDLGISERRVTSRIAEATRLGLLSKRGGGYHGRTAEYEALVKVDARRHPSGSKGGGLPSPFAVTLHSGETGVKVDACRPPIARASLTNDADVTRESGESAASVSESARVADRPATSADPRTVHHLNDGSDEAGPATPPPVADSPVTRRARPAGARLRSARSRALWVPPETANQQHPIVVIAGGER